MFYSIKGTLTHMEPGFVVVECAGVGFKCLTTLSTQRTMPQIGEQVKQTMYAEPAYSDVSVSMVDDATWSKTVTQDRQYDFTIYETDGEDDLDLLMDSNSYIGFVSTDSQNAWSKALKSFSSDDYAKNFQSFIGTLDDDSPVDWICTRKPISAYRSNITGVPVNMTYTQLPLADMTTTD